MPKFFFNIDKERPDTVGLVLPSARAARGEAIRAAGEILRDIDGALDGPWRMTVRDEEGTYRLELTFSFSESES